MKTVTVGVWLSCAAACAFAQGAADVAPQIAARVRAENLKADVAFLASDTLQGRATPSPGLDAAAEYIASQFRKAGLEPVGDDNYFQTATYRMITPVMDGFELTAGSAKLTAAAIQDAVNIHGFDELIISTLPQRVSKWLKLDLPSKVAGLGLPVTTVIASSREGAVA